jgi:hypothetical protein
MQNINASTYLNIYTFSTYVCILLQTTIGILAGFDPVS